MLGERGRILSTESVELQKTKPKKGPTVPEQIQEPWPLWKL